MLPHIYSAKGFNCFHDSSQAGFGKKTTIHAPLPIVSYVKKHTFFFHSTYLEIVLQNVAKNIAKVSDEHCSP